MKEYVMCKPLIEQNQKFFMDGVWTVTSEDSKNVYLSMGNIIIKVDKSVMNDYFIDNEIYSARLKQGDVVQLQTPSGHIGDFTIESIEMKNNAYGTIYVKVN